MELEEFANTLKNKQFNFIKEIFVLTKDYLIDDDKEKNKAAILLSANMATVFALTLVPRTLTPLVISSIQKCYNEGLTFEEYIKENARNENNEL